MHFEPSPGGKFILIIYFPVNLGKNGKKRDASQELFKILCSKFSGKTKCEGSTDSYRKRVLKVGHFSEKQHCSSVQLSLVSFLKKNHFSKHKGYKADT